MLIYVIIAVVAVHLFFMPSATWSGDY